MKTRIKGNLHSCFFFILFYWVGRVQKRRKYKRDDLEEEQASGSRMHVRIPQAVAADYDIVPQSVIRQDSNRASKVRTG